MERRADGAPRIMRESTKQNEFSGYTEQARDGRLHIIFPADGFQGPDGEPESYLPLFYFTVFNYCKWETV